MISARVPPVTLNCPHCHLVNFPHSACLQSSGRGEFLCGRREALRGRASIRGRGDRLHATLNLDERQAVRRLLQDACAQSQGTVQRPVAHETRQNRTG